MSKPGYEAQEEEEEAMPVQTFQYYLKPEVTFKIIATRWGIFSALGGAIYTFHLLWTISGIDKFTDYTRLNPCTKDGVEITGEDASSMLDGALLAVIIFHMIEWIRWTIFLTSALVNVNLVSLFYLFTLNVPYGFIAMIIAIAKRYSADGDACSES